MTEREKRAKTVAAERLVRAAAVAMPSRYLRCRDIRHSWTIAPGKNFTMADFEHPDHPGKEVYVRELQCSSCETVRIDTYVLHDDKSGTAKMARWSVSYRYPAGYHMDIPNKPKTVKVNQILRYEVLRRVLHATKSSK
jgi:hypothetical protein